MTRTRREACSYAEAAALLGDKTQVKLYNNTWLKEVDVDDKQRPIYGVILHRTCVVQIRPDGTYKLNSGGWETVTTKDKINTYSPARIWTNRGQWFIEDGRRFFDGIVVNQQGEVLIDAS